ncbi:hypothetical protein NL676_007357 [Syzygium grande]|nr:hypothetical protein NL676_007357 [Syzygium grande]
MGEAREPVLMPYLDPCCRDHYATGKKVGQGQLGPPTLHRRVTRAPSPASPSPSGSSSAGRTTRACGWRFRSCTTSPSTPKNDIHCRVRR